MPQEAAESHPCERLREYAIVKKDTASLTPKTKQEVSEMGINELGRKAKDLHALWAMIGELQEEVTALESEIKAYMEAQGTDTVVAGGFRLTWKSITSTRFDSAAFRKAMPELASRFMKDSVTKRFAIV